MVQGDAYSIDVEITNEGQALSPSAVSLVEIALLNLVKTYPGDVTFSDGKFHFPLTQTETFGLPTVCPMQVRVKFPSGDVIGSEMQQIDVKRALSRAVIYVSVREVGGEPYDGPYTVTPDFETQELATKDRLLKDNVTVDPIVVARVENPAGGKTIFIGGIFNG